MDTCNLFDLSDRELLHFVNDARGDDGYSETNEVSIRVGMTGKHPNSPMGSRLGWMVRFGFLERHPDKDGLYRMTRIGRALMDGDLDDREVDRLRGMDSAQIVTVTRILTNRYRALGRAPSNMMRREWQRGTGTRRR